MTILAPILFVLLAGSLAADEQSKPAPPPPPQQPAKPTPPPAPGKPAQPIPPVLRPQPASPNRNPIRVRGFGAFGNTTFQAQDSFDAIFNTHSGLMYGGGGQVLLPWGLYTEVAVSQFKRQGERAFVGPNDEVFRLGIPLEATITPIDITGGYRYRHCPRPRAPQPPAGRTPVTQKPGTQKPVTPPPAAPARPCAPRVIPYGGGGYTTLKYTETSDLAADDENVETRAHGFHIVGGVEYQLLRWVAVGGEVAWSSIPDAIGGGGVSAAFAEDNLGGTTLRLKISVGR